MGVLTLGVDSGRDLFLDASGSLSTKTGQEAMAQLVTQRLSHLPGELLFNKTRGIPYMTTIFETGLGAVGALRTAMISALENTTGVVSVPYLGMNLSSDDANELQYSLICLTEYGNVAVSRGV